MANHIEVESFVTGYHIYRTGWVPTIGENLRAEREPDNDEDKYAVCVKNGSERIVGHLQRGASGRFARTVFFFLRADTTARCVVTITGKPVNLGDNLGVKVPCMIRFTGRPSYLQVLETQLETM